MSAYKKDVIIKAAKYFGIEVNCHIKGRKDIHYNILSNFAKSVLIDRDLVKKFINHVKKIS